MRTFTVKVRTTSHTYSYPAVARHGADLIISAWDQFEDAIGVSVTPRGNS